MALLRPVPSGLQAASAGVAGNEEGDADDQDAKEDECALHRAQVATLKAGGRITDAKVAGTKINTKAHDNLMVTIRSLLTQNRGDTLPGAIFVVEEALRCGPSSMPG
ncbi:MAG: hypothetical protein AAF919_07780 [Pseudomonadota bacterium]